MKAKTDKKHVMFAILALLTTMVVLLLATVPAMAGPVHLNRDAARGFVGVDPHTPRHILDQIGSLDGGRATPIPEGTDPHLGDIVPGDEADGADEEVDEADEAEREQTDEVEEATETDEAEEVDEADDSDEVEGDESEEATEDEEDENDEVTEEEAGEEDDGDEPTLPTPAGTAPRG